MRFRIGDIVKITGNFTEMDEHIKYPRGVEG